MAGVFDSGSPSDNEHTTSDHDGLSRDDHIQLAAIRGRLRTVGSSASCAAVHTCANPATTSTGTSFEAVAARIARVANPAIVADLANRADPATRGGRASRQLRPLFFVSASLTSSTDRAIVVLRQIGRRLECDG